MPGRSTRPLGVIVTIRQHIKRRLLIAYGLCLVGALIFVATGAFRVRGLGGETPLMWLGFVPFVGGIIFGNLAVRCPRCNGNLGQTAAMHLFRWSKKHRLNFCHYCGVSVDEPVITPRR